MHEPQECRCCASRKFWRVAPVMLPKFNSSGEIYTMPAICRSSSGSTEPNEWGKKQQEGTFTAWICVGCGLTEWFAEGVSETLQELARNPESGVSCIDLDDVADVPYR